ncbi:hypothetical protein M426DRAFT_252339 [Hypoxylon sp. CI-4A]|nr:hypothetical protein M426DRAFT_252339 [Hypoxylon sp. CI-4A]
MFITLKNPNGANDSAMEQVAVTSAGTPAPTRSIRKAACIACQAKKIRCTGRGRSCDRCKTRSIACIFPSISAKPRLGSTQGSARRGSDREEQIELEDGLIESENRDATKSPSSATDTNQHDPSDGGFTSSNILNCVFHPYHFSVSRSILTPNLPITLGRL